MRNQLQNLYNLILKEQWRVTKTERKTHYNVTVIHIYLEATKPADTTDFLGISTQAHITLTTYHL